MSGEDGVGWGNRCGEMGLRMVRSSWERDAEAEYTWIDMMVEGSVVLGV
jgi:hypothetical protein